MGRGTTKEALSKTILGISIRRTRFENGRTYDWRGLVTQDIVQLLEHLWCQLRQDLERLQVVEHLVGVARAKDDGRCLRLGRQPCKGEMGQFAAQFCNSWVPISHSDND